MCNCRFVSVQITKVDEPLVSCTRTFECVKLSRWRMGARLVTLYVESSSVDTSIHQQDFNLHSWTSQTSTWSLATAVVTCNYTCANMYDHKHWIFSGSPCDNNASRLESNHHDWTWTETLREAYESRCSIYSIYSLQFLYLHQEFHTTKWSTLGISMQQACS